jgi:predicted metal-dependent hydrolase
MKPCRVRDNHSVPLDPLSLDWTRAPLAEGLACFHRGEFFLAHEHWEAVWLTLPQPEKDFLQTLIQVAAAFHHLQHGNRTGAISLLTRALRRLDAYPPRYAGIDLADLCTELDACCTRLTSGDPRPNDHPSIRLLLS